MAGDEKLSTSRASYKKNEEKKANERKNKHHKERKPVLPSAFSKSNIFISNIVLHGIRNLKKLQSSNRKKMILNNCSPFQFGGRKPGLTIYLNLFGDFG